MRCNAISLVVFGVVALTASVARAQCECPSGSVEQAVRNADRIFRGHVVSASLATDDSRTIEFSVQINEALRGDMAGRYTLTTAAPGSCGVPVRLGFHDMYVLSPGENRVSRCTGSGRYVQTQTRFLAAAIAVVELPTTDVSGLERLLSRHLHSGFDRAKVEEFFALVERIDPAGHKAIGSPKQIEYRGIVVYLKDGKFQKVDAL